MTASFRLVVSVLQQVDEQATDKDKQEREDSVRPDLWRATKHASE